MNYEKQITSLLSKAGIAVNGTDPGDITVHNRALYGRIAKQGSIGLGEAYMAGWWDSDSLDIFFAKVLKARLNEVNLGRILNTLLYWRSRLINFQTKLGSRRLVAHHYDLGNDLYEAFLDPYMQYSCGYWDTATDLDAAQLAKMELCCQKLQLKERDTLLDIGSGFGGLVKFATEHYGCKASGITLSTQQHAYAKQFCAGLPVDLQLKDYRAIAGTYDKIVSVGMFEHVGYKNYRHFFEVVHRALKPNGIFLLHSIGNLHFETTSDHWVNKYIFPNSHTPHLPVLAKAAEGLFILEDLHNFGAYYDPTLMSWLKNFRENWPRLADKYGPKFKRMWEYYLSAAAASFRTRKSQLWQMVFTKDGFSGVYKRRLRSEPAATAAV